MALTRRGFLGLLAVGPFARFFPKIALQPTPYIDPIFDEINAVTLKEIWPRVVRDEFFKSTPFEEYLRSGELTRVIGTEIQHD